MGCWAFDRHAFVLVGDLDVVDVDVGAPNVNAVQTTLVGSADDGVVNFSIGAGVHGQVEGGRVDQLDVVEGEVVDLGQPDETRAVGVLREEGVAIALYGTLGGAREHLEVVGIGDGDHVAAACSCAIDDAVQL